MWGPHNKPREGTSMIVPSIEIRKDVAIEKSKNTTGKESHARGDSSILEGSPSPKKPKIESSGHAHDVKYKGLSPGSIVFDAIKMHGDPPLKGSIIVSWTKKSKIEGTNAKNGRTTLLYRRSKGSSDVSKKRIKDEEPTSQSKRAKISIPGDTFVTPNPMYDSSGTVSADEKSTEKAKRFMSGQHEQGMDMLTRMSLENLDLDPSDGKVIYSRNESKMFNLNRYRNHFEKSRLSNPKISSGVSKAKDSNESNFDIPPNFHEFVAIAMERATTQPEKEHFLWFAANRILRIGEENIKANLRSDLKPGTNVLVENERLNKILTKIEGNRDAVKGKRFISNESTHYIIFKRLEELYSKHVSKKLMELAILQCRQDFRRFLSTQIDLASINHGKNGIQVALGLMMTLSGGSLFHDGTNLKKPEVRKALKNMMEEISKWQNDAGDANKTREFDEKLRSEIDPNTMESCDVYIARSISKLKKNILGMTWNLIGQNDGFFTRDIFGSDATLMPAKHSPKDLNYCKKLILASEAHRRMDSTLDDLTAKSKQGFWPFPKPSQIPGEPDDEDIENMLLVKLFRRKNSLKTDLPKLTNPDDCSSLIASLSNPEPSSKNDFTKDTGWESILKIKENMETFDRDLLGEGSAPVVFYKDPSRSKKDSKGAGISDPMISKSKGKMIKKHVYNIHSQISNLLGRLSLLNAHTCCQTNRFAYLLAYNSSPNEENVGLTGKHVTSAETGDFQEFVVRMRNAMSHLGKDPKPKASSSWFWGNVESAMTWSSSLFSSGVKVSRAGKTSPDDDPKVDSIVEAWKDVLKIMGNMRDIPIVMEKKDMGRSMFTVPEEFSIDVYSSVIYKICLMCTQATGLPETLDKVKSFEASEDKEDDSYKTFLNVLDALKPSNDRTRSPGDRENPPLESVIDDRDGTPSESVVRLNKLRITLKNTKDNYAKAIAACKQNVTSLGDQASFASDSKDQNEDSEIKKDGHLDAGEKSTNLARLNIRLMDLKNGKREIEGIYDCISNVTAINFDLLTTRDVQVQWAKTLNEIEILNANVAERDPDDTKSLPGMIEMYQSLTYLGEGKIQELTDETAAKYVNANQGTQSIVGPKDDNPIMPPAGPPADRTLEKKDENRVEKSIASEKKDGDKPDDNLAQQIESPRGTLTNKASEKSDESGEMIDESLKSGSRKEIIDPASAAQERARREQERARRTTDDAEKAKKFKMLLLETKDAVLKIFVRSIFEVLGDCAEQKLKSLPNEHWRPKLERKTDEEVQKEIHKILDGRYPSNRGDLKPIHVLSAIVKDVHEDNKGSWYKNASDNESTLKDIMTKASAFLTAEEMKQLENHTRSSMVRAKMDVMEEPNAWFRTVVPTAWTIVPSTAGTSRAAQDFVDGYKQTAKLKEKDHQKLILTYDKIKTTSAKTLHAAVKLVRSGTENEQQTIDLIDGTAGGIMVNYMTNSKVPKHITVITNEKRDLLYKDMQYMRRGATGDMEWVSFEVPVPTLGKDDDETLDFLHIVVAETLRSAAMYASQIAITAMVKTAFGYYVVPLLGRWGLDMGFYAANSVGFETGGVLLVLACIVGNVYGKYSLNKLEKRRKGELRDAGDDDMFGRCVMTKYEMMERDIQRNVSLWNAMSGSTLVFYQWTIVGPALWEFAKANVQNHVTKFAISAIVVVGSLTLLTYFNGTDDKSSSRKCGLIRLGSSSEESEKRGSDKDFYTNAAKWSTLASGTLGTLWMLRDFISSISEHGTKYFIPLLGNAFYAGMIKAVSNVLKEKGVSKTLEILKKVGIYGSLDETEADETVRRMKKKTTQTGSVIRSSDTLRDLPLGETGFLEDMLFQLIRITPKDFWALVKNEKNHVKYYEKYMMESTRTRLKALCLCLVGYNITDNLGDSMIPLPSSLLESPKIDQFGSVADAMKESLSSETNRGPGDDDRLDKVVLAFCLYFEIYALLHLMTGKDRLIASPGPNWTDELHHRAFDKASCYFKYRTALDAFVRSKTSKTTDELNSSRRELATRMFPTWTEPPEETNATRDDFQFLKMGALNGVRNAARCIRNGDVDKRHSKVLNFYLNHNYVDDPNYPTNVEEKSDSESNDDVREGNPKRAKTGNYVSLMERIHTNTDRDLTSILHPILEEWVESKIKKHRENTYWNSLLSLATFFTGTQIYMSAFQNMEIDRKKLDTNAESDYIKEIALVTTMAGETLDMTVDNNVSWKSNILNFL